ncbi:MULTISPECIES: hypothetical protein [Rhizobium]|uniref:hypothetical protein n=1 Tax=Rhizobium TaxID=379 RepID=UPI00197FB887|nr:MULTISPECIES: hypothetical protein [Rhizobium]MBY5565199.1 hypothetical protein [Rhizobium leguminosarum]
MEVTLRASANSRGAVFRLLDLLVDFRLHLRSGVILELRADAFRILVGRLDGVKYWMDTCT